MWAVAAVAGVLLRAAAWSALPDANTFPMRLGMGPAELDVVHADDVMQGLPADSLHLLWLALRSTSLPLWASCAAADLLAASALHAAGAPVWAWVANPLVIAAFPLSLSSVPAALCATALALFPRGGKARHVSFVVLSFATYANPTTGATLCLVMLYIGGWRAADLLAYAASLAGVALLGASLGDVEWGTRCVQGRPNWGFHWYVHLEVFGSFREMFCCILTLFTPGIVLPYAFKLHRTVGSAHAALTLATSYALCVATSLSPSFVEYIAAATLVVCACPGVSLQTSPLVYVWAFVLCFCLGHCYLAAWLTYQSANVNFFYFVTLVWGLAYAAFTIEYSSTAAIQLSSGKVKQE